MKHLTAETIKESHYIPANNMAAAYLVGGEIEARDLIARNLERHRTAPSDDFCQICTAAFAEWYEKSCNVVIDNIKSGKGVSTDYPPLIYPQH
jgi:hypothetical protein